MTQGIYTIKDDMGRPLYIGSSANVERRLHQHSQKQAWWPLAHYVDIAPVDSWPDALRVERQLIRTLNPRFNTQSLHPSISRLRSIATCRDLTQVTVLPRRRKKALTDVTAHDVLELVDDSPIEAEAHRVIPTGTIATLLAHGTIGAAVEAGAFKTQAVAA